MSTERAERIRERYDISQSSLTTRIRENWIGYAFVLPTFILFTLLFYYPIVRGFYLTFTRVTLGGPNTFVGLDNYVWVVTNDLFFHSLKTTIYFASSTLVLQMALGLLAALLLNEIVGGYREWLAALIMAPYFTANIAAGITWKWFLNAQFGFTSRVLRIFQMEPIGFLYTGVWPFVSLVVTTFWHDFPWAGVIYLAALQGIPAEHYEAAAMDGAGRLERFRQVTLPHLKTPTIVILAIRTVYQVKEFAIPLQLTGGGPGVKTTVLAIWTYRIAYVQQFLARGYVVGLFMVVVALLPVVIYIRGISDEEELYV